MSVDDEEVILRAFSRGLRSPSRFQFIAVLVVFWIEMDFRINNEVNMEQMYARYASEESPLLHYLAAFGARIYGRMEVSIARFTTTMAKVSKYQSLRLACEFEIAWCHYICNNFALCAAGMEEFLRQYKGDSFCAFAAYLLGVSYLMMNNADAANNAFRIVKTTARPNFSYDQVRYLFVSLLLAELA